MTRAGKYEVAEEVVGERIRQDAKWGEQNHPDGTGESWLLDDDPDAGEAADLYRRWTEDAVAYKRLAWRHILIEEVAEAFAETDPAALRAELIQVAAVAQAWAEAIDRRTS